MIANIFLGIALLGALSSTIFACLLIVAAIRFQRGTIDQAQGAEKLSVWPPVSLLKPLYGAEPGLQEYLESFFHLDYPDYEILFCARVEADAGLQMARAVAALHPEIPVRFLLSGSPPWPNARCYSLSIAAQAAMHDTLVITDSDVRVRPDFLRAVVAPLADPAVGAATCVYRGAASGMGIWALMEGLGMSVEMTSGVLIAEMLEGMRFTLGPAMIVRKRALETFGGFSKLGYYYADDFMLGNLVASHGGKVVLCHHVIDHCIVNNGFWHNFSHQWNWAKSTRWSRPWGHFGTGLTFAMPYALLGLGAALASGRPALGVALLSYAWISRTVLALVAGYWVVGDPDALRFCWLYPLRDLMGFGFWALSYTSRRVGWRDDRFVLEKDGLMRKIIV